MESVFEIVECRYGVQWHEIRIMDLFAGSGALGIEALSRGAGYGIFVERERQALAAMEKNIQRCGLTSKAELIRADVFRFLNRKVLQKSSGPISLIFADPPYGKGFSLRLLDVLLENGGFLQEGGIVVIEDSKEADLSGVFRGASVDLDLQQRRIYADTALFFCVAVRSRN